MKNDTLVSCICITRNRPHLLERAINCFQAQTYSNKELVILYESDDTLTHHFLSGNTFPKNIKLIRAEKSPDHSLGSLRNIAIKEAEGLYICQWDDDDWYHPERLSYQCKLLKEHDFPACVLGYFLIFDVFSANSYLSCYRQWEGSLLCRRDLAVSTPYSNLERGEDTPVIFELQKRGLLFTDDTPTPLYHYTYHGKNTWDQQHFEGFYSISKTLSLPISQTIQDIVMEQNVKQELVDKLDRQFKTLFESELQYS